MRLVWLAGLSLLLTACAPLWQPKTTESPEQRWQQQQQEIAALKDWRFRGRTAITQGREGWNAGITWQQQGEGFDIKLSGPFSQGGAELIGDAEQVTLTLDNGEQYSAQTPEQLLAKTLGWFLPVSALRDWVRGVPYKDAAVDKYQLDENGRLKTLQQAGWQVEYLRYVPFNGLVVPSKIFIKHPDLNIRLIISDWSQAE
ncbi:lipoprotein insertase outer membrane protein LolB [Methylophaga sulfidovorans]|uniref:Outer-membrane lipoprotein LolB n=1 Tax=Methylophaga sulfidovorans TaxID=45496 RepID=A0A1I4B9S4_9GAMM|nr:lipoprotein insertase outer membrane protein LolB [Methylophaga sulfidovorans]SFK65554.1 outer membrane lipoprotein LolB [Methylophaga sulfidovorans]